MSDTETLTLSERAIVDINVGEYNYYATPGPSAKPERECVFCRIKLIRQFGVIDYRGSAKGIPESGKWYACKECVDKNTWIRADGDVACRICGFPYADHQEASGRLPFLRRLCSGQLVKL